MIIVVIAFVSNAVLAQECYEVIYDYTGLSYEVPLQDLTAVSCEISDLINSKRDQDVSVPVLDLGYYFISSYSEGSNVEQWNKSVSRVKEDYEFYILFGRLSNDLGSNFEVFVDINIPEIGLGSERIAAIESIAKAYLEDEVVFPSTYYYNQKNILSLMKLFFNLEICDNEIDDDGDGFVDCEDLDCTIIPEAIQEFKNSLNKSAGCTLVSPAELECLNKRKLYFQYNQVNDLATALAICGGISDWREENIREVPIIQNGIDVDNTYVPSDIFEPGRLIGDMEPRKPHFPPSIIAEDMSYGLDGDTNIITTWNRHWLRESNEMNEDNLRSLVENSSLGGYQNVGNVFLEKFYSGNYATYVGDALPELIRSENETINAIKRFGLIFESEFIGKNKNIDSVGAIRVRQRERPSYSRANGYLLRGPTILLNDVNEVDYYLNFFNFNDATGDWQALLYMEIIDHFGLDDQDPQNTVTTIPGGTVLGVEIEPTTIQYQTLNDGFASWWILQKTRNFRPFVVKLRIMASVSGNVND